MKLYLWSSHKTSRNRCKPIKWCAFLFNVKFVYPARWRLFTTPDTPWRCGSQSILGAWVVHHIVSRILKSRILMFCEFLYNVTKLSLLVWCCSLRTVHVVWKINEINGKRWSTSKTILDLNDRKFRIREWNSSNHEVNNSIVYLQKHNIKTVSSYRDESKAF